MSKSNGKGYEGLFDQIGEIIHKIIEQCDDEGKIVEFVGSFVVMNPEEEFEVIANRIFSFGTKEGLRIAIEGMLEDFDKEEDDFINW